MAVATETQPTDQEMQLYLESAMARVRMSEMQMRQVQGWCEPGAGCDCDVDRARLYDEIVNEPEEGTDDVPLAAQRLAELEIDNEQDEDVSPAAQGVVELESVMVSGPLMTTEEELATLRRLYEEQSAKWVNAERDRQGLLNRLEEAEATVERQREEGELFLERVVERLHSEADNRDWCSEYDAIMADLGFPRRYREYTVAVDATIQIELQLRARSDDEASEAVDESRIWQEIRAHYGYSHPDMEIEVTEVYEAE